MRVIPLKSLIVKRTEILHGSRRAASKRNAVTCAKFTCVKHVATNKTDCRLLCRHPIPSSAHLHARARAHTWTLVHTRTQHARTPLHSRSRLSEHQMTKATPVLIGKKTVGTGTLISHLHTWKLIGGRTCTQHNVSQWVRCSAGQTQETVLSFERKDCLIEDRKA